MEYCSTEVCIQRIKFLSILKKFSSIWNRFKENLIYIIATCFLDQNRIIIFSSSSDDKYGNIRALAKTLCDHKMMFIWLTYEKMKEHPFKSLIILARARVLVVDASSPAARVKLHRNTYLIHCWHACGAYKKIGFDAKRKNYMDVSEYKRIKRIHRGISWFVCTSEESAKIYAKSLRLPMERMLVFGSPRLDEIIQNKNFVEPKVYTILYAPTYRTHGRNTRYHPKLPDAKVLQKTLTSQLGENIKLVFRGHPTTPLPENFNGWENWSDISQRDALNHTSVLITDYSSIFFDFLVYNRPIIFYIPDYYNYLNYERELYFSPYDYFDKTTCTNLDELIKVLIKSRNIKINNSVIWKKFMSACDGYSSERICLFIKNIL